ncbi:MAG: response regulator [Patescibacteria group bacterium]|nr:response regulator [Patescibacteria group bacterium]MDE1966772.1 response regulator [Patescibacteria group bacterium]
MTRKILFIEDEVALQKSLLERLLPEGIAVIQAVDGQAGLDLALKDHPDLILLDIVLPKLDGIEFLKKLRQDPWGKTAPVIILTNLADNKRVAEAMGLDTFEYLLKKDWDIDEVAAKIHQKLKDRAA